MRERKGEFPAIPKGFLEFTVRDNKTIGLGDDSSGRGSAGGTAHASVVALCHGSLGGARLPVCLSLIYRAPPNNNKYVCVIVGVRVCWCVCV